MTLHKSINFSIPFLRDHSQSELKTEILFLEGFHFPPFPKENKHMIQYRQNLLPLALDAI